MEDLRASCIQTQKNRSNRSPSFLTPGLLPLLWLWIQEKRKRTLLPFSFCSISCPKQSQSGFAEHFGRLLFLSSLVSSADPSFLFIDGSAQLLNFSHHTTLTNIPHKEALLLAAYFGSTLTLSLWRMHKAGLMRLSWCVSLWISSNADQYHGKVTLKFI